MHPLYARQGQMSEDSAYFYTETISDFKTLLYNDQLKMILINSWQYLVKKKLVEIYGYVIMPNHFHLIWRMLKMNGKETPAASFSKYTAHEFKKYLNKTDTDLLQQFKSDMIDRDYQFWIRDPLAIPISNTNILIQKLSYIHDNPIKPKWSLCAQPEDYRWSSANFYETGVDEFGILTDYKDDL